jgi:hypothetical protein
MNGTIRQELWIRVNIKVAKLAFLFLAGLKLAHSCAAAGMKRRALSGLLCWPARMVVRSFEHLSALSVGVWATNRKLS